MQFETLPDIDQAALGAELLRALSDNADCFTIDDLAAKRGRTTLELWASLCAEVGIAECTIPVRVRRTGQAWSR